MTAVTAECACPSRSEGNARLIGTGRPPSATAALAAAVALAEADGADLATIIRTGAADAVLDLVATGMPQDGQLILTGFDDAALRASLLRLAETGVPLEGLANAVRAVRLTRPDLAALLAPLADTDPPLHARLLRLGWWAFRDLAFLSEADSRAWLATLDVAETALALQGLEPPFDQRHLDLLPDAIRLPVEARLRADGPAPPENVRDVLNRVLNHVAAAVERGEMVMPVRAFPAPVSSAEPAPVSAPPARSSCIFQTAEGGCRLQEAQDRLDRAEAIDAETLTSLVGLLATPPIEVAARVLAKVPTAARAQAFFALVSLAQPARDADERRDRLVARLREQAVLTTRENATAATASDNAANTLIFSDGVWEAQPFLMRLQHLFGFGEPEAKPLAGARDPFRAWLLARAATIAEPLPVTQREALRLAVRDRDRILNGDLMRAGWGSFEDIADLPPEDVQTLIRQVTGLDWALALQAASDGLRTIIVDNLATRAAKILKEDMACIGPIRLREAVDAQRRIMDQVRDLLARGEITGWKGSLDRRGGGIGGSAGQPDPAHRR